MKNDIDIESTDGVNTLHTVVWEPEGKPRAILQISHGMIEHIERYDDFAGYLNSNGIAVVGNDHLGHGKTAGSPDDYGYFGAEASATVVSDLFKVTGYAKERFGSDVPYFLLGHSMGSFMARRYLIEHGGALDGAIICGTGYQPPAVLAIASAIAACIGAVKGDRYRPESLKKMAFGSYNKRIPDAKSPNSWLSRDDEVVKRYDSDPMCTFSFTADGYRTLFGVLKFIQKKKNYGRIPKDLPVFMVAGEEDPVGNYGKGVEKVFRAYSDIGIEDISLKLYPNDRHEILNEPDKEDIYSDILLWLESHI